MNLNHLTIFHAVAQTGSMTLGAERLDISQPAVSKQVQELERALGVPLFDRIGRRVRLSQAGELLADYARRLFALAREAEEAMADVRHVGRGRLAVGASTTIGTYLLPAVVAEFGRRYPGVALLVEIANTEQVHRRLARHELDVGLTEGFVEGNELDAEVFHEDELVVIASHWTSRLTEKEGGEREGHGLRSRAERRVLRHLQGGHADQGPGRGQHCLRQHPVR